MYIDDSARCLLTKNVVVPESCTPYSRNLICCRCDLALYDHDVAIALRSDVHGVEVCHDAVTIGRRVGLVMVDVALGDFV